jgi:hypothetical protein
MNQADKIKAKTPKFREWLTAHGAQVLEPTNEWELIRFKSGDETCVIYRNKAGAVTYSGPTAEKAQKCFVSNAAWRANTTATKRKRASPMIAAIRKRDGDNCFYCRVAVSDDTASAEHLVSTTHGGPNHISNLFLAHKLCNAKAGHLSAPEKIAMHVRAVLQSMGVA